MLPPPFLYQPTCVVKFQIDIEDIHEDRQHGVAQLEAETLGDEHHWNAAESHKERMKQIKARMKAADLL